MYVCRSLESLTVMVGEAHLEPRPGKDSAGPLKPSGGGQVLGPCSHPLSVAGGSWVGLWVLLQEASLSPPSTPWPVWPMEGLSLPHKAWIFAGPSRYR